MPKPRQPPGRPMRTARRIGTRMGISFALHKVLVALVPMGCPLGLPFIVIEAALAGAWVWILWTVGFMIAGVTLAVTSVLVHPWFLALMLTIVVVSGYVAVVVYLHVRLIVWWFKRTTR